MAERELAALSISGGPAVRDVTVRDLRHREVEAYVAVALANLDALDRRLGLDRRAARELAGLSGYGIWFLLRFLRLFGRAPVRLLVAEEHGTPVGTTATMMLGPWAYVVAVGVLENHRKRGIAAALVRRAEEVGRLARKQSMVLEVNAENEPARRLYAKLGWGQKGTVRWWELSSAQPAADTPGARAALRSEMTTARILSVQRIGIEIPMPMIHPCEMVCRGTGAPHETVAAGPSGSPTLVVRCWAGREGESGFVVPVVTGATPHADEDRTLEAARAWLFRHGNRGLFVPVLGEDRRLEALLGRAGASPAATTEVWCKSLGAA